jgi:hypothetical protein
MIVLCRYLDLGAKAGLIKPDDAPKTFKGAIAQGLPDRGTVISSDRTKPLVTKGAVLPSAPVDLLTWASGLSAKPTGGEFTQAARLVRDHNLLLPGWNYAPSDLDEYRHAGCLSEFGWELLPP